MVGAERAAAEEVTGLAEGVKEMEVWEVAGAAVAAAVEVHSRAEWAERMVVAAREAEESEVGREVVVKAEAEVAMADVTEDLKEMVAPMGQSGTGSQLRT